MMKLIENNKEISLESIQTILPEEYCLLKSLEDSYFCFELKQTRLELKDSRFKNLFIDIEKQVQNHHYFFCKNSVYQDPLAKALGIKKNQPRPFIIDATAGMLKDCLLIHAYQPLRLVCFERNPVIAILIINALRQISTNIEFIFGQALDFPEEPEVIFYDPMYKEKNTKTAPKKEMALLRELLGGDEDSEEMAIKLFDKCLKRLVIKRSNKGKSLISNPHHTIKGKSTSYDVYLK